MTEAILTLNAGSSSLKFALFSAEGDAPLATGLVDRRIGQDGSLRPTVADGGELAAVPGGLGSHAEIAADMPEPELG